MFHTEDNFDTAFANLVETIDTDLEHKKTHTRLQGGSPYRKPLLIWT